MELKKHTPEEFEQMSDEEFENYRTRLFEIAEDIFLKRYTIEELEVSLLRIKELAKNKKKKYGHSYWRCSKEEKACMYKISSAAERFKKLSLMRSRNSLARECWFLPELLSAKLIVKCI